MPDFNGQRLTNVGAPIFDKDAVNLNYLNYTLINFTGGTTGGTLSVNYLPLSGGTVSGTTNFNNGSVIQSGGTDLYNIFSTGGGGGATTFIQPGRNISTGGTNTNPIINLIDSPSINSLSFSGTVNGVNLYAINLSGETIYSANTNINYLFADKVHSHSQYAALSGANFSGNIQSGGTDLYNIFLTEGELSSDISIQNGLNTYTGGTVLHPTVNISAATLTSLSSTTISGDTFYSGSTSLYTIIKNLIPVDVDNYLPLSGGTVSGTTNFNNGSVIQSGGTDLYNIFLTEGELSSDISIQNGLNTYTGGTVLHPTVNISAATLTSLSSTTISGDTFYSGSTDLSNLFATQTSLSSYTEIDVFNNYTASTNTELNILQTEINSLSAVTSAYTSLVQFSAYTANTNTELNILQTEINTKANLSGATFTGNIYSPTISGGTFYSGSTPLSTIIQNISTLPSIPSNSVLANTGATSNAPSVGLSYSSLFGTANNLVSRDANGNTHANNFESALNGNAAIGTIILTNASARNQVFTSGSGTATVLLPDATTLQVGHTFEFNNNASGSIIVSANTGTVLFNMTPGSCVQIICLSNSFTAGQWDYHWSMPSNSTFGTTGLTISNVYSTTINSGIIYSASTELSLVINNILSNYSISSNNIIQTRFFN